MSMRNDYETNLHKYDWFNKIEDRRTQQIIVHAAVYAHEFAHGANGHNDMLTIHFLTEKLCEAEDGATE